MKQARATSARLSVTNGNVRVNSSVARFLRHPLPPLVFLRISPQTLAYCRQAAKLYMMVSVCAPATPQEFSTL